MKLGIGGLDLPGSNTGIGVFNQNVGPALMKRFSDAVLYTGHSPSINGYRDRSRLVFNYPFPKGWSGVLKRMWVYQARLRAQMRRDGISLFYSMVHEGVISPACPQVVTLYDLIPLHHPQAHPKLRLFFNTFFRAILRTARGVICISEATRRDLMEQFAYPKERTRVALLACNHTHFHPRRGRIARDKCGFEKYFLFVGSTAPHKNVLRALEAFARLEDSRLGFVMVGPEDPRMKTPIRERISELGIESRVRLMGSVSFEELPHWYSEAFAFVFPSLYEGFGIPALEAMACGTPVLTSNVASLPEVCGDAALYVDPEDVDSIHLQMKELVRANGPSDDLRRKGLARAVDFTWEKTADIISSFLSS